MLNNRDMMMQGWNTSHSNAIPPIIKLSGIIESFGECKSLNSLLDTWVQHNMKGTKIEYTKEDLEKLKSWDLTMSFMDFNNPGAHNHTDPIKRSLYREITGNDFIAVSGIHGYYEYNKSTDSYEAKNYYHAHHMSDAIYTSNRGDHTHATGGIKKW